MRITFLFPTPNFSGGCRVVATYAQGLALKGHDVTIVAVPSPNKSFFSNIKRVLKKKCWLRNESNDSVLKKSHFSNLVDVNIKVLHSHRPIKNQDVPDGDIVIATWWETAEWLMDLNESKGKKLHFIQGYEIYSHLPVERVKAIYQLPLIKITIAQWLIDILRNQYGNVNVELVPNGVDTKLFNAQHRNKQNSPVFSMMYATEKFKGTDVSIAAFEYAKKKYPNIKLLVFGSKNIDKNISLPEGATFYFSPDQEKIREIYSQSDAYIFSSRTEGFGLPVLEAMACRCPVIATKSGCAPDFIKHGVNGELNNIDDIRAQGESIIKIIEMSNSSWCAISEAAYEVATKQSWKKSIDKFEHILDENV